ncbi:MAG: hypothetical protein NVSMB9_06480 [Isosphaeraceae bacterium]
MAEAPSGESAPRPHLRANARVLTLCLFRLLALAAIGCGDPDRPAGMSRKAIPLDQVPAPVMKGATTALPGVSFDEVWKNLDREGTLHSYEVRGRARNGKVREVRVASDGKILEME